MGAGQTQPDTQVLDARTIATMPAFTAGGRSGHCSITLCRSGSRAAAAVSTAAPVAAQLSGCAGFPGVVRVVSGIITRVSGVRVPSPQTDALCVTMPAGDVDSLRYLGRRAAATSRACWWSGVQ